MIPTPKRVVAWVVFWISLAVCSFVVHVIEPASNWAFRELGMPLE